MIKYCCKCGASETGVYEEMYTCSKCQSNKDDKKEEIRRFETGAIRDSEEGKEDMVETISWLALKRFSLYMTDKKKKYGSGNWDRGINPSSYISSFLRHTRKFLCEWQYGICEEHDNHLSAIIFNVLGLMHELELYQMKQGRFEISEHYKKLYLSEGGLVDGAKL